MLKLEIRIQVLILGITFQYNSNITTKSNEALESLVSTTVSNYNTSSLKTFNSIFRYSEFIGLIDDTESSVLSNITTVTMAQYLTPVTTSSNSYTIDFSNAFYHPHSGHNESTGGIIASTGFNINDKVQDYYFDEDGNGNLRIYYLLSGEKTYHDKTAGTVDYDNGKIIIDSVFISSVLDVDGASSTRIRITAIPSSNDIVPVRNQVLEIDEVNTVIKGTVDQISTSGVGYTTTTTAGISTTTVSTTSSTPTRSAY